ncbi:MAG: hypothetical protein ACXW39_03865 [Nitrospira sp.]
MPLAAASGQVGKQLVEGFAQFLVNFPTGNDIGAEVSGGGFKRGKTAAGFAA